jgi:2-hydroxy-3-oxopropionate reductase
MTTVGFIGLGIMGRPMSINLARAGFDVVAYSRRPESAAALAEHGVRAATSIAECVTGADIVVTMLPDSPDVETVVLGDNGVLAHAGADLLIIDMSTVRPATAIEVATQAKARDARALDAPVSGGERGAIDGTLSIMVGGDADDVERARPVLEAMGRTIVHVGPAGAGQTVKAANQLMVGGIIAVVSEALLLIERTGVDPEAAVTVLAAGLAGSRVLDQKATSMLKREFTPGFRIDLHHKDLGIALNAAGQASLALPVTGLISQLFIAARAQNLGSSDHSAILQVIARLSNTD